MTPTAADIRDAQRRIEGRVHRTPLEASSHLGENIYLKLECWQRTRSFKVRGAFNAVASLSQEQRERGLVTASAGNHGQAVALAGREFHTRVTVFVPQDAPVTKKSRIAALGARLDESAAHYDEAERLAVEYAENRGATFVHAYSDHAVVAGQGTVALEILEELPTLRTVVVPVGGGGLVAGIGILLREVDPTIRVIGAQGEKTSAMHDAFRAGRVVDPVIEPTLADGLSGAVSESSYGLAKDVVDDIVLVSEDSIAQAIRALYNLDGVVAEGSAAVGVAALMAGKVPVEGTTVVIITGGNIDASRLASLILSA
ncbi:MAG TPA: threonine/serine dehydratase [Longimicrobiales bacterium]|nr:threonine/serine dehydratase [Longimicrobiales bacterium]